VLLPGANQYLKSTLSGTGWSVGGNYSVHPNLAVYALVSSSFRLPSLEQLNQLQFDPSTPGNKVEKIMQYEGGVRFYADTWDNRRSRSSTTIQSARQFVDYRDFHLAAVHDERYRGGHQQLPAGARVLPSRHPEHRRGSRSGLAPSAVKGLELRFNGVLQDPRSSTRTTATVKELRVNDVVTGYAFEQIGEDGRRPRRLAQVMLNLQGTWDTKPYTGLPFKPYFKYTYFGSRYSESQDVNVTLYPAYYHLDGGFIWDFSKNSAFQLHVSNITNRLSFTEGDPVFTDLKGPTAPPIAASLDPCSAARFVPCTPTSSDTENDAEETAVHPAAAHHAGPRVAEVTPVRFPNPTLQ
jgi:outer membrane receptor protein involved in Fe transport